MRREIPTTTVPGTEGIIFHHLLLFLILILSKEEPEPPQPPQLTSEVEHNLRKFPFVEFDLYRGTSKGISSGNLLNRPDVVSGRLKGSISIKATGAKGSSSSKREQSIDVSQIAKPRPYLLSIFSNKYYIIRGFD